MADDSQVTLSKLIGQKFVQRRDVKAKQLTDGSWRPVESKFTKDDLESHLAGDKSFGHYMVDGSNKCKLFAYDIDCRMGDDGCNEAGEEVGSEHETVMFSPSGELVHVDPRAIWMGTTSKRNKEGETPRFLDGFCDDAEFYRQQLQRELRAIGEGLAYRVHRMTGFPVAVASSGGKGLHVYCFTGERLASEIREVAHAILLTSGEDEHEGIWEATKGSNFFMHRWAFDNWEVECFPKQDTMDGKKLGNLMALPLGRNFRTGRRRQFLTFPEDFNARPVPMDPVEAMSGVLPWEASPANIIASDLYAHAAHITDPQPPRPDRASGGATSVPGDVASTASWSSSPAAVPSKSKLAKSGQSTLI